MEANHKGFTLIELVISMAILAVLGTAVGTFLYTSMKQYHAASSEVSVQTEEQMVQNQLQNLLLDATKGICFATDALNIYNHDTDTGKKEKIVISYVSADEEILYTKYYLDETNPVAGSVWKIEDGAVDESFAGYVNDFSVKFYDAAGTELADMAADAGQEISQVKVHIRYQLEKKKYESDFVVAPRNDVVVMDGHHDIF